MIDKIKFAVVGCGHIGKRHAAMIANNPHAELLAMCDTLNKEALDLSNHPTVAFYNNLDEMLATEKNLNVVCIATPNGLHAAQALKVLEHNHHVVIEKPMGLTKTECEDIIYKSLQASKQVFCVMQNRYSPPSQWLKTILQENLLGEIYMVQINCYWNRDHRYYKKGNWHGTKALDGGTLFTQFSHFVDIMYWCFGDITNIHSRIKDFNHQDMTEFEDSGMISFDFVQGGIGSIQFSTSVWDKNLESSMTIIGENGTVKIGGQYMNEVEYCHIKDYEMPVLPPSNPPNDYGQYKGSAANHHFIIENVIDVLRGNSTITTNALEGLKVVDIIERIYKAAK